ncbi:hypothetical protein [Actinokineospora spheciospongiae]
MPTASAAVKSTSQAVSASTGGAAGSRSAVRSGLGPMGSGRGTGLPTTRCTAAPAAMGWPCTCQRVGMARATARLVHGPSRNGAVAGNAGVPDGRACGLVGSSTRATQEARSAP